jgi:acetoin utilization protein AcuB
MLVRDIMTRNVVTIESKTPFLEAERIMISNRFERLPVVDEGRLVGLVTKDNILRAGPSSATSLCQSELLYILSRLTVKEIMKTHLVTVVPETTVEKAVSIAQGSKVGCLLVMVDERLVGIVTTNDFFYKIINPLFGIDGGGSRIKVYGAGEGKQMQKVLECVNKLNLTIDTLWKPSIERDKNNLIVHLEEREIGQLISELTEKGFGVELREYVGS